MFRNEPAWSAVLISRPAIPFPPTVSNLLRFAVDNHGAAEFVVTETERLTYAQTARASRLLAKRLIAAGAGKGSRVGTQFPYGAEWLISWLAIERIGSLHMPFSTALKPPELTRLLRHGDVQYFLSPAALFGEDRLPYLERAIPGLDRCGSGPLMLPALPYLRSIWLANGTSAGRVTGVPFALGGADTTGIANELVDAMESEVSTADYAIAIFTSGTSAEPKAVLHTHGALVTKGAHLAALQGWHEGDRIFCGMPFFWVGGIAMTIVPAMWCGATLLCLDRTEPLRALDLMERERATRMTGWPGVRVPIEGHPSRPERDIPAFTSLPPGPQPKPSQGIGMTETLAAYTFPVDGKEARDGSLRSTGRVIDGCEVRIVDPDTLEQLPDGEPGAILVRGYPVTTAFYKRDHADIFTIDGFYNTGDEGYLRDSELYFTGRLTEMIKTSGNNVAPPEVEAAIRAYPEIEDVHVLGIPDELRGETVAALVIPAEGASVDPEEIRERVRTELSNFKVPRHVVPLAKADLPWLASGKPDRLAIRKLLIEKVAAATQVSSDEPPTSSGLSR
jgi:acyl-CoA synthetase (AMP-forming)/AMP-acid ligase II